MKIRVEDVLTIKGEKYTVIDTILYEGKDYILTNKVINDEPSETFIAYEVVENGVFIVEDKNILDRILPIFSNNVNKKINDLRTEEQFNIW